MLLSTMAIASCSNGNKPTPEKKDKYTIEMDLPGYEKENISLELKDGYLEVSAEVHKEENT